MASVVAIIDGRGAEGDVLRPSLLSAALLVLTLFASALLLHLTRRRDTRARRRAPHLTRLLHFGCTLVVLLIWLAYLRFELELWSGPIARLIKHSAMTPGFRHALIAVVEMSQSSWLVAGMIPGVERHPAKKLEASEVLLLSLLHRWREEAIKAGRTVARITVAVEAGRDGFWPAPHGSSPWAEGSRLRARGIEACVIHARSIAVSREHRGAKTDRLDTALLKRAFLGWLGGERDPCSMAAIPSLEEDAKRPSRERESLPGERAHPHRQPDQEHAGAPGYSRLQAGFAQSGRAA